MEKLSLHGGHGSARHNARNFATEKAEHIADEKLRENKVFVFDGWRGQTDAVDFPVGADLTTFEIGRYTAVFGKWLDGQHERNRKNGHSEKDKTMEQVYASPRYRPREDIVQLGSVDGGVKDLSGGDLLDIATRLFEELQSKYGANFVPLSLSLHMDETTPHIHARYVLAEKDKDGNLMPNQERALAQMGFTPPKPMEKTSKFNNRLISWTKENRERLIALARERGHEIDDRPREYGRGMDTRQFINTRLAAAQDAERRTQERVEKLEIQAEIQEDDLRFVRGLTASAQRDLKAKREELMEVSRAVIDGRLENANKVARSVAELVEQHHEFVQEYNDRMTALERFAEENQQAALRDARERNELGYRMGRDDDDAR